FTGAGLGARSRRLNMPRWNGGTGSITSACLSPSETSRLLKPRKTITPCWTKPTWQLNLNQIASDNPGAVQTSPEIIRLAVMMYVRFPLSLRNVEDLLHERGIDICHETVRYWWNRFGPLFASEIRKKRLHPPQNHSNWRWHLDEVFVMINGETHYLWRAVDHEGEVLECFVS